MYVLSRVRLCNPIDCSPPGLSIHGILQARTLEWVAISFSNTNIHCGPEDIFLEFIIKVENFFLHIQALNLHSYFLIIFSYSWVKELSATDCNTTFVTYQVSLYTWFCFHAFYSSAIPCQSLHSFCIVLIITTLK